MIRCTSNAGTPAPRKLGPIGIAHQTLNGASPMCCRWSGSDDEPVGEGTVGPAGFRHGQSHWSCQASGTRRQPAPVSVSVSTTQARRSAASSSTTPGAPASTAGSGIREQGVVRGEPVDPVHQLRPVGGVGAGRPPLRWRRRGWWWGWGRGQGRGVLQLIDQGLDRGLQRGDPVLRGGHGVVIGRWPIRAARTRVMPAAIWAPSGRSVRRIMGGRERIVRGQFHATPARDGPRWCAPARPGCSPWPGSRRCMAAAGRRTPASAREPGPSAKHHETHQVTTPCPSSDLPPGRR